MNRAKRRRQERQKLGKQAFSDSIYPVHVLDPDTDLYNKYFLANCLICNREQTLIIDESFSNYYCGSCGFGVVKSNEMKNALKVWLKENRMARKYPDESFANLVSSIDEDNHAEFESIKVLLYDCPNMANDIRNGKLYKSYPKSATDEDRMAVAFWMYNFYSKYKMNLQDRTRENLKMAANILRETIKQDAIEGRSNVV